MSNTGAGYDTSDYEHVPRILIFDIETAAFRSRTWGKFQQNVIRFDEPWHLLCFAYKWWGEGTPTEVVSQPDFERDYKRNRRDDRQLAKALWDLFNEADIVIAHNGAQFDVKKANARFAKHGFGRPSPFKVVDTKQIAKRSFNFGSNSLADLGFFMDLGGKVPHAGFDMWEGCEAGDPEHWKNMTDYNIQDVELLEALFEKFYYEGWVLNMPDMNLLMGKNDVCPTCGSTDRQKRGWHYTTAYRKQQYQCKSCKSYYHSAFAEPGTRSSFRKS